MKILVEMNIDKVIELERKSCELDRLKSGIKDTIISNYNNNLILDKTKLAKLFKMVS